MIDKPINKAFVFTLRIMFVFALTIAISLSFLPTLKVHAAETVANGTCGENVNWTINSSKVLTISGAGAMSDSGTDATYREYLLSDTTYVNKIIIEEGVTTVGENAFKDAFSVRTISISSSVESIKEGAFRNCDALNAISIPYTVQDVSALAFSDCDSLEKASYYWTTSVDNNAFSNSSNSLEIVSKTQFSNALCEEDVFTYTGETITPNVIVKDSSNNVLEENIDYVLERPSESVSIGSYSITVNGIEPYSFTSEATYSIEEDSIFDGGDGSQNNPYQISTKEQFDYVRNNPSAHYVLNRDIDFYQTDFNSNGPYYNDGQKYIPIEEFSGVFDGNGHKITALQSDCASGFCVTNNGTVKNLEFKNCIIKGNDTDTAGIAVVNTGTVDNCSFSGSLSSSTSRKGRNVGGIVANNKEYGVVSNCINKSNISFSGNYELELGGIIGTDYTSGVGTVSNCSNEGSITVSNSGGYTKVGGIVGYEYRNDIVNCSNSGQLSASSGSNNVSIGGIAGYSARNITTCYNIGKINGSGYDGHGGGIAGSCYINITNSYNLGDVVIRTSNSSPYFSSNSKVGGISGAGTAVNCYNAGGLDVSVTKNVYAIAPNTNNCYCVDTVENASEDTQLSLSEMKYEESFEGFDFQDVWTYGNACLLPVLQNTLLSVIDTTISITDETLEMFVGDEMSIDYTLSNNKVSLVAFESYNNSVATVDSDGVVKALKPGTAKIQVSSVYGKSERIVNITISRSLQSCDISGIEDVEYTGNSIEHNIVVKDGDTILSEDADYTINYKNNTNAGVAEVVIEGAGEYKGTIIKTFNITPTDISDMQPSVDTLEFDYTGEKCIPKIELTGLSENIDYEVELASNVKPGTAKATVKGINNYSGSIEIAFNIICRHNSLQHIEQELPTCDKDGNVEHWYCPDCEKLFADSDCKEEIHDAVVKAIGHNWEAPTYTWSADNKTVTATRICKNDPSHTETEIVNTTAKVTKKATYTAKGQTTYTATFKNSAFKTQTKTLTDVAQLAKKANTLKVKAKKPTVKFSKLKKKAQKITVKKAFTVSKAQGKVTYKKVSGNKKITINKAGKITIKKGLKKGTYKLKVKVSAAGTTVYKAGDKTVTVTIKVK